MKHHLMPLTRAVVEITHEARPGDFQGIRKAVKSWHNRLSAGSIPRAIVTKLGRSLFLDLDAWEAWFEERAKEGCRPRPGRPRSD
ncbi:MAG: hypothetical protein ACLP5H_20200 [Desulfomonilaceae bacterium]